MQTAIFELRYDGRTSRIGLTACVLITGLGILVLASMDSLAGLLVGAVFVAAGGFGTREHWRRLHDPDVALHIGADGILDRRLTPHLLRWEQVAAMELRETYGPAPRPFIDLRLRSGARIAPGWRRVLWRLIGAHGFPISQEGLNGTFEGILVAARYFAAKRGVRFVG